MNKVILMGRLTREPDVRYSQNADGSMAVARYTLAVDRRRARNNNDEQSADFISCVAFGRSGEFAESKSAASGETAAYTPSRPEPSAAAGDGFMNIPDGVEDEGLPFN
mgnify:CR=1 FL=1